MCEREIILISLVDVICEMCEITVKTGLAKTEFLSDSGLNMQIA